LKIHILRRSEEPFPVIGAFSTEQIAVEVKKRLPYQTHVESFDVDELVSHDNGFMWYTSINRESGKETNHRSYALFFRDPKKIVDSSTGKAVCVGSPMSPEHALGVARIKYKEWLVEQKKGNK
jgi:hypothetical protein